MRITVVGKGNVGGGLADLWERAGHTVTRLGRNGGDVSDAEVVLLNLRLRPRQRRGAVERRRIAILLGEAEGLRARRRDNRREGGAYGIARRHSHAAAQAHDRIEHRAGRVGEGLAVDHRRRRSDPAPAAEEPRSVSLPLQLADRVALHDRHMGQPDRGLAA